MLHALKKKKKKGDGEEIKIHYSVYKISGFFYLKKFIMKRIILRICSIRYLNSRAFAE